MKRFICIAAVTALTLVGCSGRKTTTTTPGSTPPTGGPPAAQTIKVGMVLDVGGLNDQSFNQGAVQGLNKAKDELKVDVKTVESAQTTDYQPNLQQLAEQGYNLVFAVGFNMKDDLAKVAPNYPNVKFAIIDGQAPDLPNCVALTFKEEEGSFLAGYLAAATSKTHKLGFVGGEELTLIKKFEAGYKAGAKTANPATQVLVGYTGSWVDTNKGKSLALNQFGQGADIVYHAAGQAGKGVIDAAVEKGENFYAIGVDMDQDGIGPGRVLTSMVKRVDNAVYDTVQRIKENRFQAGAQVYGLKEKGVGLSDMKFTRNKVDPKTLQQLDALRTMIEQGAFQVPIDETQLAAFKPPVVK